MKRKRGAEETKQDPKLQEYLSVLQRPSRSKTWANDEMAEPVEGGQSADEDGEAEDPIEVPAQRKKTKVDEPDASYPQQDAPAPEPMVVDHSEKDGDTEEPAQDPGTQEPVSDADWLRSKTSRLLGLLDEEEQAEFDATSQRKTGASGGADTDEDQDSRNAEMTAQPKSGTDKTEPAEVDTNIDHIRHSARLFVRNLPYDAKEADLESVFVPFGKIEEVSVPSLIVCVPMPDYYSMVA